LSNSEVILKQVAGVKSHESESPPTVGLKAGAFADLGSLILTNKRLLYVAKGGGSRAAAWALGGALAAQAVETSVSKAEIDELMNDKASHATPLENVTRVEAGKKFGQPYIRVERLGSEKPVHAYVFASGGTISQEWVEAINQAKANLSYNQSNPTVNVSNQGNPISSMAYPTRSCQRCGAPDNGTAKFCTSCGAPFGQVQPEMPLPPPPPPPPSTPTCPYCKNPIRYITQYQRWYCDAERKYL
jgi:hypothetical protein